MKSVLNYFMLCSCIVLLLASCKKESVLEEKNEGLRSFQPEEEPEADFGDYGFKMICQFSCPQKGYKVRIMQKYVNNAPVNIYNYTYDPFIYIYLSDSESQTGTATVTSYQYHSMKPANQTSNWNDRNGDPIVGDAYEYMLDPNLQTCSQGWSTANFTTSADPCNYTQSSIVNTMNNSWNKKCSKQIIACSPTSTPNSTGTTGYVYGEGPSYWERPYWSAPIHYGWQCVDQEQGFCHIEAPDLDPDDPNAGPMDIKLVENNVAQIMFWRDTELLDVEIDESNNEINEEFKDMFGLPEDAVFRTGSYPINFEEQTYGEVLIDIEIPE